MEKLLLHPDNDQPDYGEGINELASFVMEAIRCNDVEEDMDGNSCINIDMLPYKIPTDKKTQKEICHDLCEEIDRRNRESDRFLEEVDIGNGEFFTEDPEYYTPPVNAFFENDKLKIY